MTLKNDTGISLPLAVFLAADDYDYNNDKKTISATSLLNPLKSVILSQRVKNPVTDIADLVPARIGQAVHSAVEVAWKKHYKTALKALGYPESVIGAVRVNPNTDKPLKEGTYPIYLEKRNHKRLNGWVVSGKFDIVFEGTLHDIKTTKVYNWIKGSNDKKYVQQASIYRWLNPDIVTKDHMYIEFIFTDWNVIDLMRRKDYPPRQVINKSYPLMSPDETENFIARKLALYDANLDAPQENLPNCNDEELWANPTLYKYFGKPENVKSSANFENRAEAYTHLANKGKGLIKEVKGTVKFCKYCNASSICKQAASLVQEGRLVF